MQFRNFVPRREDLFDGEQSLLQFLASVGNLPDHGARRRSFAPKGFANSSRHLVEACAPRAFVSASIDPSQCSA